MARVTTVEHRAKTRTPADCPEREPGGEDCILPGTASLAARGKLAGGWGCGVPCMGTKGSRSFSAG